MRGDAVVAPGSHLLRRAAHQPRHVAGLARLAVAEHEACRMMSVHVSPRRAPSCQDGPQFIWSKVKPGKGIRVRVGLKLHHSSCLANAVEGTVRLGIKF